MANVQVTMQQMQERVARFSELRPSRQAFVGTRIPEHGRASTSPATPASNRSPPDPERGNMAHFCLRIDGPHWDALATHLRAHGIEFEPPETRYGADGHGPSVYITDPEGNIVELKGDSTEQHADR